MAEEELHRSRRSSARSSDECPTRCASRSTLSSPSSSPHRHNHRKYDATGLDQRRVSAEALEQGIAALRSQYGHRKVSVAYVQGSDHSAAVLTVSNENSPVMERARTNHSSRSKGSPGYRSRRHHSSMVQHPTKSSMLASPKTGPQTSPRNSTSGSSSSPILTQSRRERPSRGARSQPTSKTALLSGSSSHWDRAHLADHIQYEDEDVEDEEDSRTRARQEKASSRRTIEMAVAGCVILLGSGALLVAFMWGGDFAWTIVGSTCMSLGALFLLLGICWYLSKVRENEQVQKLEIRVVNPNQMAQLIKQGFKVKPINAV